MNETGLLVFASVLAVANVAWMVAVALGMRATREVKEVLPEAPGEGTGDVDIVVTACNEEAEIARTVERFLAQRHVEATLVVVDDRSTDRTGEILEELAARAGARESSLPGTAPARGEGATHAAPAQPADPRDSARTTRPSSGPRLEVVRNRALPEGWLGKVHACHLGATRTRGRWLLFADADVALASDDALARIVSYAEAERLDHVAILPDSRPMGVAQEAMVRVFGELFLLGALAFDDCLDRRRGGAGVGAFNLVRREAYERIGGHQELRLEVGDDYWLGRFLKGSGARQRLFFGHDVVHCPWHRGAFAVVRGLEKNLFPGFECSVIFALVAMAFLVTLNYGPLVLALLVGASARYDAGIRLAAVTPLVLRLGGLLALHFGSSRRHSMTVGGALLRPLGVALVLYALVRSTTLALVRGGIRWRGTFYPLSALRRAARERRRCYARLQRGVR